MRRDPRTAPCDTPRLAGWIVPVCLVAAMLLGGGSALYPRLRLGAELFGLIILVAAAGRLRLRALWQADRVAMLIAAGLVTLILVQLIPLPVGWWSALPGRGLAVRGDELMFGSLPRRPLNLDPEGGIRAALMLVPAIALYGYVRVGDDAARLRIAVALVAGTLLSLLLGLVQLASGQAPAFHLFIDTQSVFSTGVFANRNHQAALMAVAVPLLAAVLASAPGFGRLPHGRRLGAFVIGATLLSIGALLTASRSGAVLLMPAWLGGLLIVADVRLGDRRKLAVGALVGAIVLVVLVAVIASSGGPLAGLAQRSLGTDDPRWRYWPQSIAVLRQYWPTGAGFGTFRAVYDAAEPLPLLGTLYANHVHNDWIELLLEGGVPVALLLILFLAWFARAAWRAWRAPTAAPGTVWARAGSVIVGCLLLHSVVDYPLRTVTLAIVFAFALAMLSPVRPQRARGWKGHAVAVVAGVALGWVALLSNMGAYFARTNRPELATGFTLARGSPNAFYALILAQRGEKDETVTFPAARAVLSSPTNWRAFRAAELAVGDPQLRAQLGEQVLAWTRRDPATLLQAYRTRSAAGDTAGAIDALDAYLRLPGADERVLAAAVVRGRDPRFAAILATHLARRPSWRVGWFIHLLSDPEDRDANAELWRRLALLHAPVSRAEAAPLLARYGGGDGVARGAGYALWLAYFAAGHDPAALAGEAALPGYDWSVAAGMESHVGLLPGRMDVDVPGGATQPIAGKTVALGAGAYRLAIEGDPTLLAGLTWSVACDGTAPVPRPVATSIAVPACAAQTLTLYSAGGAGTLTAIRLVRVPDGTG